MISLRENDSTFRSKPVAKPVVSLVGNAIAFSRHTLAALSEEHPDAEFIRVANVDELRNLADTRSDILLVILDENFTSDLISDPAGFSASAGNATLAVMYRDPATAAEFLVEAERTPGLTDVGLMPFDAQIDVWISLIELLLRGEVFYPSSLFFDSHGSRSSSPSASEPLKHLTDREWEVLRLIHKGLQNKRIAADLAVSEHTVKLHVHHLLRKLNVPNRTSAAAWYSQNGDPQ